MNAQLSNIISLIEKGNFAHAENLAWDLHKINPKDFNINKLLGISLLGQKKNRHALKAFLEANTFFSKDIDTIINIAHLYSELQNHEESIKYANLAIDMDPTRPEPYQSLSNVMIELYDFEKAEYYMEKSIELRKDNFDELCNLGDTLQVYLEILVALKKNEKFNLFCVNFLDRAIQMPLSYFADNYFPFAVFRMLNDVSHEKIKVEYINFIKKLIESDQYENKVARAKKRTSFYIMLAEFYDKEKKTDKANEYYVNLNNELGVIQRVQPFFEQKKIKKIISFFESQLYQNFENTDNKGEGLIFVVGMPRSGTTLTESILSTCPDLFAGGEKIFFPENINVEFIDGLQNITKADLNAIGENYLKQISYGRKDKRFFSDKLPGNYINVGFIKMIFPNAKFIHIHRDPWDNAISLYKQFYVTNIMYASSFFTIATEYANYEFIMGYWNSLFRNTNTILNVAYENLVSNTQIEAERIWEFCELPGSYIPEKRTSFFTKTASQQQVKQKIYSTSLKKADFTEFKDDFLKNLDDQKSYMSSLNLY